MLGEFIRSFFKRFHPLHRSAPVDAAFLTGERVTKAFFTTAADGVGFIVADEWTNPVVRAEAQWVGYTFLTMKTDALQGMNIQLESAESNVEAPWVPADTGPASDVEVLVGQRSEMETPRRTRPNAQPGLLIGRLYLDNFLATSGTGTLSSGESQEIVQPKMPEPSVAQSVGYGRGGVIERGAAAMGVSSSYSASSSSNAPAAPRAYAPLVEEWALISDEDP